MADRGIIFAAPMVRALLDGRKGQTRRLFKPHGFRFYTHPVSGDRYEEFNRDGVTGGGPMRSFGWGEGLYSYLPYASGDRLYVREAYSVRGIYSDVVEVGYRAHSNASHTEFVEQWPVETAKDAKGRGPKVAWPAYRPSIHMPRWASRLWLAVTDVRVQRLQDISEADAIAEGVAEYPCEGPHRGPCATYWSAEQGRPEHGARTTPVAAFKALWETLHTKPGERWEDNPWIVAVSFDVHRGNIDRSEA
jgi:hypothetical protein